MAYIYLNKIPKPSIKLKTITHKPRVLSNADVEANRSSAYEYVKLR